MILQALIVVFSFVDQQVTTMIPSVADQTERLDISVLVGIAWVAYVFKSQRVRSTFLGPDGDESNVRDQSEDDDDGIESDEHDPSPGPADDSATQPLD